MERQLQLDGPTIVSNARQVWYEAVIWLGEYERSGRSTHHADRLGRHDCFHHCAIPTAIYGAIGV